jgi:hypothetical protein
MIQRLAEETVRSDSAETDKFARCVEWAIRYYRRERFSFNESVWTFNTAADQASSGADSGTPAAAAGDGYAPDFLRYIQLTLKYDSTYFPLDPISHSEYRDVRTNDSTTGIPELFSWYEEKFYFYQTPDDAYEITLDYIKDIGTPLSTYADGSWSTTIDGVAIPDSYTSSWFDEAANLIAARARFQWYSKFDRNKDEAAIAAGDERQELRSLRIQSNTAVLPPVVRPFA